MRQRLLYILLVIAITSCDNKHVPYNNLLGIWRGDCNISSGHIVLHPNTRNVTIEVNSNQIVINAVIDTALLSSKNQIILTLKEPEDLGRGGMMLDWQHFSHNRPIAALSFTNTNEAKLEWYGFYNDSTKQYEWVEEPDLLSYPVLKKCKE